MAFSTFNSFNSNLHKPKKIASVNPYGVSSYAVSSYGVSGTTSDGYTIYTFTTGTYTMSYTNMWNEPIYILAVGGGGAGGADQGGGGGAGGVIQTSKDVSGTSTITISVGNQTTQNVVMSGNDTTVRFDSDSTTFTAYGGGYGAGNGLTPAQGGSGGGVSGNGVLQAAGGSQSAAAISANNIGKTGGGTSGSANCGGGGGAGGIGVSGSSAGGGSGGNGVLCTVTGIKNFQSYGTYYWGGGGGGATNGTRGGGGAGTGGSTSTGGTTSLNSGTSGSGMTGGDGGLNTGGGGGGGMGSGGGVCGRGGSGIVIIAIKTSVLPAYSFRVKGNGTSTVPTTDIISSSLTNTGSVTMYNDSTRGYVFNFSGANYLSIAVSTPVTSTKTFWVSSSTPTAGGGNVFSGNNYPIWFSGRTNLQANSNFPNGTNVYSSKTQIITWVFYAVTTTATSTSIYVNGIFDVTASTTYSGDTSPIQFGAYTGTSNYTGYLDDMRLYPSVLSDAQILSIYNESVSSVFVISSAVIASAAIDYQAFMNYTGSSTTWVGNVEKDQTGAYTLYNDLNGITNDSIRGYLYNGYRLESGIVISSTYSVTFWLKRTSNTITKNQTIVNNYSGTVGAPGGQLFYYCDTNGYFVTSHGATYATDLFTSTIQFPLNTWVHIGITYNYTTNLFSVYKNGVFSSSQTKSSSFTTQTSARLQVLDSYPDRTNYESFPGNIDNMRIYSRLLSSNEVYAIYYYEINNPKTLVITGGGSGGTLSKNGDYYINTFLSSSTFTITETTTVNYLIVAGGGSSGYTDGTYNGGGGGGGYKLGSMSLAAGSYTVTVGNGGDAGGGGYPGQGGSSIFNNITATGGGRGAGPTDYNGQAGASGGGGAAYSNGTSTIGGIGITGQGNNGSNSFYIASAVISSGGGGGATSAGTIGSLTVPSAGGTGITISSSNLTGYPNSTTFCGGGGGSYDILNTSSTYNTVTYGGIDGSGGGGKGMFKTTTTTIVGTDGTANTGGGGGAGGKYGAGYSIGGSGIVILTYNYIPDILWYKFNSTDISSNGLNLLNSATGDYNALCTTSNMIVNNALNLDAINSIDLKLTNNTTITSFTTTQSVSYTCWINVTNLNTQANPTQMHSIPITMAYYTKDYNILPFEFQYSNSTSFIWQRSNIGGDCLTINNPPSINYNTYAHYAFIVENTGTSLWTFKRYVNNILIDTLLSTATNNPSLIPFSFANYPSKINSTFDSSSQYFKNTTGALDDFRVYNYALTSSQVTSIYNSRN